VAFLKVGGYSSLWREFFASFSFYTRVLRVQVPFFEWSVPSTMKAFCNLGPFFLLYKARHGGPFSLFGFSMGFFFFALASRTYLPRLVRPPPPPSPLNLFPVSLFA